MNDKKKLWAVVPTYIEVEDTLENRRYYGPLFSTEELAREYDSAVTETGREGVNYDIEHLAEDDSSPWGRMLREVRDFDYEGED